MKTPDFQSCQTVHSHAHKSRSAGVSFGRFTERCRTPIWWRRARISNWRAAWLRNDAASETMSAVNKCPSGNRRMSDKLQFINLIGIYGRHRWPLFQTWSLFVSCNFSIELLFAPM